MFLLGVFWKRPSGTAAFIALIGGMALGAVTFYLDWNNIYRGDFMLIAFVLLVACIAIMVAATFIFPAPLKPEREVLLGVLTAWSTSCSMMRFCPGFGRRWMMRIALASTASFSMDRALGAKHGRTRITI